MRALEQLLARARARVRASTDLFPASNRSRPARVSVRLLDEGGPDGLPGFDGARLDQAKWEQLLIGTVEWLGPCEVRFVGGEPLRFEALPLLVRFAHRLECTTSVVTTGEGFDLEKAKELIDRGLSELIVWASSVDDAQALEAIADLVTARVDRGRDTKLTVWVPLDAVPSDLESRVLAMGAGQVLATGSWTEGGSRAGRCPIASRRVELRADGTVAACPFKAPIGTSDGTDLAELWQRGDAHFSEIASCDSGCVHPELISRHG